MGRGAADPEGPGTPTAVINDKQIPMTYNGVLFDGSSFAELMRMIHEEPEPWAAVNPWITR